jgi:hypothetical protein
MILSQKNGRRPPDAHPTIGLSLPGLDAFSKWPWLGVVDAARAWLRLCQHHGRRCHTDGDPRGGDGYDRGGRAAYGAVGARLDDAVGGLLGHERVGSADTIGYGLPAQRPGDRLVVCL